MEFIRLAEGVRLRREPFGGLAYHPRDGTTVELDRGAHRLIELSANGVRLDEALSVIVNENLEPHPCRNEVQKIAHRLCDLGLIERMEPLQRQSPRKERQRSSTWPEGPDLSAPEAVHWAVTYRCDNECPDCYAARQRAVCSEVPTSEALDIIDRIADWGTFQLAIGGGEPLIREDIAALVRRASDRGLSVHVTTSGDHLTRARLQTLSRWLTCLQIGIRHHDLLSEHPRGQAKRLTLINDEARALGVSVGANLILCATVLQSFEQAIDRLVAAGFRRLTILRYKPPASTAQWHKEAPNASKLIGMEARIAHVLSRYPDLNIRLDCGLAFLQRRLRRNKAKKAGIRGCVAGSRIVAVAADGSVYPCSQLVGPRFHAGNILRDHPADVWMEPEVLSKIRAFRSDPGFTGTRCGRCLAVERCGGCRVFTPDGLGGDPGCPGPVRGVFRGRAVGDLDDDRAL